MRAISTGLPWRPVVTLATEMRVIHWAVMRFWTGVRFPPISTNFDLHALSWLKRSYTSTRRQALKARLAMDN